MRKKILFITLISLLSFIHTGIAQTNPKVSNIDYSKPKEYEIGGVTVSGIKYLDHNVLVHISGLKVGNKINVPGDDITQAINKLWKHGLFGDVKIYATKIQGDKIFLDIYLKERPRLSKFSFNGVSRAETEDQRDEVKLMRGSQVTDDLLNITKSKIQHYYVEKGFYNAEIDIQQEADTLMPNTVVLDISIDKKVRVKINEIIFEGNEVYTESRLRRTLKETKQKTWYNLFKASKYRETKFKEDKKALIAKYNEDGYRDAKIEFDSVYKYDEKTLNLVMKIHEGSQYYFRNIKWVGNSKYPSEYLEHQLRITKGDLFDQATLDQRLFGEEDALSSLYLDKGYLFFSATPVEVKVENDSIDLEIRIFEGTQARVNRVIITGNTRTNEHVIRREVWTKPGELFSRSDIIRTTRELAQLGYFDPEKLDVRPTPNPSNGTVDLEYIVEERASDQIELSGGWGGGMVIGTIGLTFNNFSMSNIFNFDTYSPLPTGDGQKLSIRGQTNGKYYQSFSASFTEPWLGGKKPNSLSVSAYHSLQSRGYNIYSNTGATGNKMKITGASVGLGRRLAWPDSYFTLYNELSFQRYILDDFVGVFSQYSNGRSHNFNFTTVIGRNSVDSPLYPRRGSNYSLSLSLTPPYSLFKDDDFWLLSDGEKEGINNQYKDDDGNWTDQGEARAYSDINNAENGVKYKWIEYHKWKFKADWYTQIVNKLVLRTNVEFGYLGTYNSNLGYSPFESFQLGGDGMTGGGASYYYGRDIIPLRGYDNGAGYGALTAYPQANVYNKYTMELRYPLTLNPSATIYALAFLEAGNTWYEIDQFDPFNVYRAGGVGLRFWLPMFGMLGVDWGYGFDPVPGRPTSAGSQFAFTIGQQF